MKGFVGTWHLLRLAWRRDRVLIPATVISLAVLIYYSVVATLALYSNVAERVIAAKAAGAMPSVIAMYGHIYDPTSLGGIGTAKVGMIGFLTMAILAIAIVRRHTRAEEESGRFELLGATVYGRRAPLAAAVTLSLLTSLLAGVLTAVASGAGGLSWTGSWAMGLAVTAVGLSWTGITAIAVQLSESNRTCGAFAFGSLALAFFVRMIGDLNEGSFLGVLTWLSPLGWAQQVRPFAGDRFWVLVIPAVFTLACLLVADRLQASRDISSGLFAQRPGVARGQLGSAEDLAQRLQRTSLIGWAVSFALLAVVLGFLIDNLTGFITDEAADMLRKMGGVGMMTDLYISVEAGFMALAAAVFGVGSVLRLHGEESSGHAEQILATKVTRTRFLASHGVIAFVGTAGLMILVGVVMGLSHAIASGGWSDFWRDSTASFVQIPPVLVIVAIACVVFAWLPRQPWVAWLVLAACFVLGEFGALLKLPDWIQQLSPFAHIPKLPAEPMSWTPVLILLALTAALVAAAVVGLRRRDLATA
ncbi:MAG TPA: ABC transporter permease, partial [Propionibacteriaceae bacterium]|nr:ABC transporter permease [Propionibacteriaceae bacterium]